LEPGGEEYEKMRSSLPYMTGLADIAIDPPLRQREGAESYKITTTFEFSWGNTGSSLLEQMVTDTSKNVEPTMEAETAYTTEPNGVATSK
jgi:cell division protein YceG involved in septum cleavage